MGSNGQRRRKGRFAGQCWRVLLRAELQELSWPYTLWHLLLGESGFLSALIFPVVGLVCCCTPDCDVCGCQCNKTVKRGDQQLARRRYLFGIIPMGDETRKRIPLTGTRGIKSASA